MLVCPIFSYKKQLFQLYFPLYASVCLWSTLTDNLTPISLLSYSSVQFNWCSNAGWFWLFLLVKYLDCFHIFGEKKFSCNCLNIYFYAFAQPVLTTWHPHSPSPIVPYSLIDVRTLVAFSFVCLFFSKKHFQLYFPAYASVCLWSTLTNNLTRTSSLP